MRHMIVGFALASFVSVSAANAAESKATPPDTSTEAAMPAANWLFVQVGNSFASDGKTLTISGVAPATLMFSDRPERMTGDVATSKFTEHWASGKDNFQKDPPNATVSTTVDGKPVLAVVELMNPRLSGDAITYDIHTLDGQLPSSGKAVSVFIDWWHGPGWHRRWGGGFGPWAGGRCWRGPWGHLHCRPY